MAIDAYTPCPCDSGQKIKFCCGKSVLGDLSQILDQSESGQSEAAFDRLNRTIEKSGPLNCLSVIKVRMLIGMGRMDEAEAANESFLVQSPKNSVGLQARAAIHFQRRNVQEGIQCLQDVIELYKGSDIPGTLSHVFRMAAVVVSQQGAFISGLAHLSFAMALLDDEQRQSLRDELREIMGAAHWLLRQPLVPAQGPDDAPWSKLYDNVHRAVARGQFRRALLVLEKIEAEHPGEALVIEGIAIVKSILAMEDAADAWTRYADLPGLPRTRRIEALAFAFLVSSDRDPTEPFQVLTFNVSDFAAASEQLIASRWVSDDRKEMNQVTEDVPPRYVFVLFSREVPANETYDETFQAAKHVGLLRLYGKQTDQNARLTIGVAQSQVEEVTQRLQQILGDAIDSEPAVDNVAQISIEQGLMERSIEPPSDLKPEEMRAIGQNELDNRFVGPWSLLPLRAGSATSIRDAIKDPSTQDQAYGRFVYSVLGSSEVEDVDDFHRIREKLGLPNLEPVDIDTPRSLTSPFFLQFTDVAALETRFLGKIVVYLQSIHTGTAARPFLDELLAREDRKKENDTEYKALRARMAHDPAEAMQLLDEAIAAVESGSIQEGICRVDRLRAFLMFGEVPRAQSELAALRPFLQVPYINFLVTGLLTEMGLLRPDIPLEKQIPDAPSAPAEPTIIDESDIVQTSSESKLWLPD